MKARLQIAAVCVALSACAAPLPPGAQPHPKDPWEGFNRRVFAFNDVIDEAAVKPAARAYQEVVPEPARIAVSNFFGNLGDVWSAVNWLLQGEFRYSVEQGARFMFNSTLGLAGLIDLAGEAGLEKRSQNFAQTLGAWGVGRGPYLVLPLLGPSTVRDTAALPIDRLARSSVWFDGANSQLAATALELISVRASFLQAGELVEGIALDKYTFFREAYLQRANMKKRAKSAEDDEFEVVPSPSKPAASAP
ncbi:MlaA family lipoprotein [Inhella proteolytica]|uniref:VacJ family lipoprotein n=1 Tax=Inhella proteolytica TaxID=2795029 RepID=A0A931J315_9BURK|nr:VacJ family lipoprotein [Inhella proteolytica]MBH9575997.1 VacJ family lipoprotein [Inhella proteolytica]